MVTEGNRPLLGLGRASFDLRIGGTPVSIVRVGGSSTAPLNLALVVSIPEAPSEDVNEVSLQTARFAHRATGGRGAVLLATAASALPAWRSDAGHVAEAISAAGTSGSDLPELVAAALSAFDGRRGRSALVVLTDGGDADAPRSAWRSVQDVADAAGIPVFVIGLRDSEFPSRARGSLGRIADTSGGRDYFLGDLSMLEMTLDYVSELIRGSYALQHTATDAGSEVPRSIKVEVNSKGAEVRAPRQAR
jgi:hypothetical protein